MVVYLDMDGVLVDLVGEWLRRYREDSGEDVYPHNITAWGIDKFVACGKDIFKYLNEPGIWFAARPYLGAVEAVQQMMSDGHEVYIATRPWETNNLCYAEKVAWVDRWLPELGRSRVIMLANKGLLRGDVLVDDKPEYIQEFRGRGILFRRPWNGEAVFKVGSCVAYSWEDVLKEIERFDTYKKVGFAN